MTVVELYGHGDCGLCDQARATLERVRADHPFELVEHDIGGDERWMRAYFERVPVVVIDGREWCSLRVVESAFRRRIENGSLESR